MFVLMKSKTFTIKDVNRLKKNLFIFFLSFTYDKIKIRKGEGKWEKMIIQKLKKR